MEDEKRALEFGLTTDDYENLAKMSMGELIQFTQEHGFDEEKFSIIRNMRYQLYHKKYIYIYSDKLQYNCTVTRL